MKKLYLFILIFVPYILYSQIRPFNDRILFIPSERVSFDIYSLPSSSKDKSKLIINVKTPYDFLIFTRDPQRSSKDFIGSFDITIEIFDNNNNYIDRKIKQEILEVNEKEKRLLKNKQYETTFSFDLKPGKYNILTEMNDRESTKSYKREFKLFNVKNYAIEKISDIGFILLNSKDTTRNKLSSKIPFGENCFLYAEIVDYDSLKDTFKLSISKIIEKTKFQIFSTTIPSSYIKPKNHLYKDSINIYVLEYPLKSDSLEVAKYQVELENITNKNKSSKETEIIWYDMPFSLRSFETAIKPLKLILPENEFKEIISGNKIKQREKFLEFWRKKDPTPNNLFNELMAEFYKRVDYAIMNFGTFSILDGSETDRGKTYIIYGKPDKLERKLIPGEEPKEYWTYERIGKRFIFIDESRNGNYKLKSIENL